MNSKILALIFILLTSSVNALEIDEKLTTRILSVSSTKKTVLLNRGLEDGLVVGDHAKFFLTTGVIARAVVSKASPTRSIWSVYRLIDEESVAVDNVVNIKISSPLKLTEDASKSLVYEPVPSGMETITVAGRGDTRSRGMRIPPQSSDEEELSAMREGPATKTQTVQKYDPRRGYIRNMDTKETSAAGGRGVFSNKSWEFVGRFQLHSLSTSVDTGVEGATVATGKESTIGFGASLEKYFPNHNDWLRAVSFYGLFDYTSTTSSSSETLTDTKTSQTNFGGGANWHFYNDILSLQKVIGFVSGSFGLINSTEESGDETTKGSGTFFSLGIGAKYYTTSGIGIRGMVDYYSQGVKYANSSTDGESVTSKAGPRVIVGASYLF